MADSVLPHSISTSRHENSGGKEMRAKQNRDTALPFIGVALTGILLVPLLHT